MAYLSGREYDIFISYTHVDDEVTHWVRQFAQYLEKELKRLLRIKENSTKEVDVTIWKDNQLPQQGNLSDRLNDAIRESSIFLAIMSESYLLSDWCKEEGIIFVNSLKDKSDLRIFIAEIEETDRSKWPEFLKTESGDPLLSKSFYEEIDVGQSPKTIPMKTPQGAADPRAARIMEEFCNDLSDQLHNFKHFTTVSNVSSQTRHIFLAISPEGNAHKYRDRFVKLLAQFNDISIFPTPEPATPEDFEGLLTKHLPQCDLFVQILDESKGRYLSKCPTGFVGHQFNAALDLKKKILHWMDPELDPKSVKDSDYGQFLRELKPLQGDEGTIVEGTLENFAREIPLKLDEVDRPPPLPRSGTFFVAIKSDIQDQEHAKEVGKAIETYRADIPIVLLYPTPQIKAKDLDCLTSCSKGIVIIWGKVDLEWVLREIDWFNQVATKKVKAGALAICDPCPKQLEFGEQIGILKMSSDSDAADRKASVENYVKKLQEMSLHQTDMII
jgi:hypothetical protein